MDKIFLVTLFFIGIILESSVVQLPIVMLLFLCTAIAYRDEWIFVLAFLTGFVIDGLMFHPLGETSLFLVLYLFIIFLYEQKFELQTVSFAFIMSFLGSLFYFLFFGSTSYWLQVFISSALGVIFFIGFSFLKKQQRRIVVSW